MEPSSLMKLYVDTLLGASDARVDDCGRPQPGFSEADFRLLRRMLFWPALFSLTLVCMCLLEGIACS